MMNTHVYVLYGALHTVYVQCAPNNAIPISMTFVTQLDFDINSRLCAVTLVRLLFEFPSSSTIGCKISNTIGSISSKNDIIIELFNMRIRNVESESTVQRSI